MKNNPVLVKVIRGECVESLHRGCAVAVNTNGEVLLSLGDVSQWVYPRSALKFFQSIPLLESGAAEKFNLSSEEIALSCASHNAEPFHISAITQWLQRLGLDNDSLECGADMPMMKRAAHQLLRDGKEPTRTHQNCSGKHTGMLTLAKFLQAPLTGYSDYHHPTQQAWMQVLSELIDVDVFSLPWERDGCGLPAICMPLQLLAQAFACYADTSNIGGKTKTENTSNRASSDAQDAMRGAAMQQIIDSIRAHPNMLAGTGRCCTDVTRVCEGRVMIKTGAEGVYGGVIPHLGIGFALKIDDGAGRAANVALGALLTQLGALTTAEYEQLEHHFHPTIINTNDKTTGEIIASEEFLSI